MATKNETPAPPTRVRVQNLPWSFTDEQLQELFGKVGEVASCEIVRKNNKASKGFGFVDYGNNELAAKAVEQMNNSLVESRRIGVVYHVSNPTKTNNEQAQKEVEEGEESSRLHVRELAWGVKKADLEEAFGAFSTNPVSCKVVKNRRTGRSKGYGFVEFSTKEEAAAAKEALDGKELKERAICVLFSKSTGPKPPKKKTKEDAEKKESGGEKKQQASKTKKRNRRNRKKKQDGEAKTAEEGEAAPAAEENKEEPARRPRRKLYVKNLPEKVTDNEMEDLFAEYGRVASVKIPKNEEDQTSRGFAILEFEAAEDAELAKEKVHETEFMGQKLEVYWCRNRRRPRRARNN